MTISRAERSARAPLSPRLLREPVHLLALGFGSGLAPVAPGTFGSLVGLACALIALALWLRGGRSGNDSGDGGRLLDLR